MRHFARFTFSALLVCLFFLTLSLTPSVHAAGITVNTDADISADDGVCTLREAIDNTNNDAQLYSSGGECAAGSGTDTITFDAGLSGATIYLGSTLTISSDITIDGAALASQITISGDSDNNGTGDVRVFQVDSGATATLNSLKITKGSASTAAGIQNSGTLTVIYSTLSGNKATSGPGGGIRNDGTLTVTSSTFSSNSATGGSGGGIRNAGALMVTNSTFSGNSSTLNSGGGIYNLNSYTVTITNSTFSGNSAGSQGGGIYYTNTGTLNYANTIIANSTSGGDCAGDGTIGTNINNLVEDNGCSPALSGDPLLDSLQDNGGPTQTFALKLSSPAINAGDTTTCTNAPVNNLDQRGATRPIGALCDIGAHEAENRVVTNTDDNGDGFCDADCSLREAIDAAIDGDVITFDASLSGGTITLASQLEILKNVTIDGSNLASKITINGNSSTRVFLVASGVTATLDSLIVTQGRVEGCCGAGLLNYGTLTITNSLFSANNNNNGTGGAIMNLVPGTLTVTGSTISGNSASNGGGIGNENQLTITNSTISANSSGDAGGGIHNNGATATLTVTNSTFSGNIASTNGSGSGGGIFSSGPLTVTNSTFSDNSATYDAGGIAQDSGTLNLANTIIANSITNSIPGGDCYSASALGINTNNLVEHGNHNCSSPLNVDPNLGPLANNGGPTQTFALLANSPAIDAGDDTTCATPEVNNLDQRGIARPNGGHCDIGAYEYVDTTAPTVTAFNVPASPTTLNIPITTFTASDDAILTGYLITESATPPTLVDSGWIASAPTTYPVASMGSYTLYPWVKDAAGHVSAVYGSGVTVNITCLTPITVTSNADSGPGTLRQAIADACVGDINNISMIDFDLPPAGNMIHLASELTIAKNITIDGSDLDEPIIISGEDSVRVFSITGGAPGLTVMLDSLTVTKGATSGHGAGLFMEQGMHVTIQNSTFSDNHAGGRGGGIGNQGGLTLINSKIDNNTAVNGGGGVSNESGLTMTNSTISNNSVTGATVSGGGLFNTGGATITNSTIFGNSSNVYGGGISTTANLTITNSTIAGNSASVTGGLQVDGNVTHLRNTIIANNTSTTINSLIHNDCSDTSDFNQNPPPTPDTDGILTNVNNLIEDGSCSPSLSGDPGLAAALADNDSLNLTQTLALLAGSNAIDAGDDTICAGTANPNPVNSLDQRGFPRPNSAHCDIGAFEYADASAPSVTAFTPTSPTNNLNIPITAFTASDDATVTGYLVTESSTPPSTGAAGWTASAPTIYTVGSAGSYMLYPWAKDAVGNVSLVYGSPASVTVDKTAPTAGGLVAANVTIGGGATYSFTVTFSDDLAIDSTSIDGSDIRVTGPGGFNQLATLVDVTPAGNGTLRTATYQITAPGGVWDSADRGTYTVAAEANQIFDSAGNSVGAASLGSFLVSVNYTTYLPLVL